MARKTPQDRKAKRDEVTRAGELDAVAMLLAAGIVPSGDGLAEARALLKGPPPPQQELYTVAEFCEMVGMSHSSFYRLRERGQGPACVSVLGGPPRIKREVVRAWIEANAQPVVDAAREQREAEEALGQRVRFAATPATRKQQRIATPKTTRRRASLMDPPPPRKRKLTGGPA